MADTVQYAGPWKGIELRDAYQTDAHCQVALNISFHRGCIEGRDGLGYNVLTTGLRPRSSHTFVADRLVGAPRLLVVGPDATTYQIKVVICSLDFEVLATVNLTTQFGETANPDFQCGMARQTVARATTVGAAREGHDIVVITTPTTSYEWDPGFNELTIRRVDVTLETIKLDIINFFYVAQPPKGTIVEVHQRRTYYAGFAPGTEFALDGTLPADVSDVPEHWINKGRSSLSVGPSAIFYSDVNAPFDLHASGFFAVPINERVAGLRSFREQLVVFTDKGLYLLLGDPSIYGQGAQFLRAVVGSGCVAPKSIEEVNGLLYYVGTDGIYTYDGQTATKISKPIDEYWTPLPMTDRVPKAMYGYLQQYALWPWVIDRGALSLARSFHSASTNQVWFSIPLVGGSGCTLVWDYIHGAWSVYRGATAGLTEQFCYGGAVYIENGRERRFLVTDLGISEYGTHPNDFGEAIFAFYLSARHAKGNDQDIVFRHLRLNMLAWGLADAGFYPVWMLETELAAFDVQLGGVSNANRIDTSGPLETHPYGSIVVTDPPSTNNTYFVGVGLVASTMVTSPESWFTQVIHPGQLEGRWWRWGFIDYPQGSSNRPPSVTVQSYSMEQIGTKGARN